MKKHYIAGIIIFVLGIAFSTNVFAEGDVVRGKAKIVKRCVLEMDSVTIHSHSKNVELQHVFKQMQINPLNIFQIYQ